jgi:hypothetical protein
MSKKIADLHVENYSVDEEDTGLEDSYAGLAEDDF